jgi:hypothetical protein
MAQKRMAGDLVGSILGKSRELTRSMAAAGPVHERRGPESMMASGFVAAPPRKQIKGETAKVLCQNCGTTDPKLIEADHKNGIYVCSGCGAVDPNPILCLEEENRVFADDTDKDKAHKKRSEYRADGGLGSYVAAGVERRGALPNAAIQSLQRTQLRLQEPPPEIAAAAAAKAGRASAAAGGAAAADKPPARRAPRASKALDRVSNEISKLAERMRTGDAIRDDACRLAERWVSLHATHAGLCADPKCRIASFTLPKSAEGAAAAFLQRASRQSSEGAGATRAFQEFAEHIADASASAMRRFQPSLYLLDYRPENGCVLPGADALVLGGAEGAELSADSTAKGLVSRVLDKLCRANQRAARQVEAHAFELLDWLTARALLVGRQPKTVAVACLFLCFNELTFASADAVADIAVPKLRDIADAIGDVSVERAQKAVDEIKPSREAHLAAEVARRSGAVGTVIAEAV